MAQPDMRQDACEVVQPYAYYALGVLATTAFLNLVDRQIISILAQSIKTDLHLSDAQLGFLLGTAFAVFYAVVGVAMGRIADAVARSRLMAAGLAVWSVMTALGGAATGFGTLGIARIGVGVGEATANPCAHSLLSQYFPARYRASALGAYLAAIYLGGAGALLLGGLILQHWSHLCGRLPIDGACSIAGWRAALWIVGIPGLLLAVIVARLREPARPPRSRAPVLKLIAIEFGSAIPPFTLITLYRLGGRRALMGNLALAVMLAITATTLALLTGDIAQWAAIALGAYSILTWSQVLKLRDRPLFQLTFGNPAFTFAMLSGALIACSTAAVSVWAAPYAMRTFDVSPGWIGVSFGMTLAVAGCLGAVMGGWLTDRWKRRDPRAPIWVGMFGLLAPIPALGMMLTAKHASQYLGAYFVYSLFASTWSGAYAAMVQDLVLERMRGTAASAFALVNVVIALGAGPYWVGKVSAVTGSLAFGLLSVLALTPVALVFLFLAANRLGRETVADRYARAEAAGENRGISVALRHGL